MPAAKLSKKTAVPIGLNQQGFNRECQLPYGLGTLDVKKAMQDFLAFLHLINRSLVSKGMDPLELFLMPANFSSIVSEFLAAAIPKHCPGLIKNRFHNGHPDLIPIGVYANGACLHADRGIEIKASRRPSGWQGHNPENVWLMVFVFDSSAPRDATRGLAFRPFQFVKVIGAKITKSDWNFSGRLATSRRTITASVMRTGFEKMEANWIYRARGKPQPVQSTKK